MLAQLTTAACSTFTSTAKSLAGGDEATIISRHHVANMDLGMNEYSLHIFNDFSVIQIRVLSLRQMEGIAEAAGRFESAAFVSRVLHE